MNSKSKFFILLFLSCINLNIFSQENNSHYFEEEISFSNKDVIYSGTLALPIKTGKHPLVILISGTGLQKRDWNFGNGYKMAKIISDSLTKKGIAVYRYDDRGVGKSRGIIESETSYEDLAADINSAILTLRKRSDISSIGLCGHSLGGILSVLVASKYQNVDFVINMAGTFQSGADILRDQAKSLKRWKTSDQMTNEDVIQNGLQMVNNLESYFKNGEGLDTVKQILSDLINYQIINMSPENMEKNMKIYKDKNDMITQSYINAFAYYTSPHQKSFITYNAASDIANVTCPILVLFGEKDEHVKVSTNKPPLMKSLMKSNASDFTLKVIPNIDHGFTTDDSYKKGEMAPETLNFISSWINFRTRNCFSL